MVNRMHFVVVGCLALIFAWSTVCQADDTSSPLPSPTQQQTDALNLQKLQLEVESSRIANEKARVDALNDAAKFTVQSIGKVTAATTNLDSSTSYAIADELAKIGQGFSKKICGTDGGVFLLTNNEELPKLLFVADQATQSISRLTKYAKAEAATLDTALGKKASAAELGKLSAPIGLTAVSIGLSAAEGIASTLRPDYQISAAPPSTDYLPLYSGIIDGATQSAAPRCSFILAHVHSPEMESPLNADLNTLDSQKRTLDLAIASAQQIKKPSAELAAEVAVAVALSKDISTFDSSLFAAPTGGGPTLFQQASDALWLTNRLSTNQKAKIVLLHLAVAGGSTIIRGATLWKNPKASYVYAVKVTGFILTRDGMITNALDAGTSGNGTVDLKW